MTFLIIPPGPINGAVLAESNVIEAPPALHNMATNYGLGANATVAVLPASGLLDVYESLQTPNVGHAPATSPLWWKKVSQVYEEYDNGKPYSADARVQITALHKVYQSVQNTNTGHNPASDTTQEWWVEVGETNRWAMLDNVVSTQTVRADAVSIKLNVTTMMNAIILDNLDAAEVHYKMTSLAEGVIREETISLNSYENIHDEWDWCFQPILRKRYCYLTDLPAYSDVTLEVDALAPGSNVGVGLFLYGLTYYIGETLVGSNVGRRSRTKIIEDDFGRLVVVKRPSSKRGEFQVLLDPSAVDGVIDMLDKYDGVPVFMRGAPNYGSTGMIGLVDQYNIELAGVTHSYLTITPRGLI